MYKDTETNEYYIETKDILDNTMYSEHHLGQIFGDDLKKAMLIMSKDIWTVIYSAHQGAYMSDHITYMLTKVDNNQQREQYQLKRAIIEHVKGAIESGMDLNEYLDQPKQKYPRTVMNELRIGMLLDGSRKRL
ncbi:MAG: hypothetical protein PF440_08640 [Thiomicrorhabdus sp.]|jgi:hypothetical protein|nr:hypothetical protein [Thiomicrorhabdus sp.]